MWGDPAQKLRPLSVPDPRVTGVDSSAWITAVIGLVGAVIGALAALLGQFLNSRSQARADAAKERKLAVEEVLVRSQAIDLRGHELMLFSTNLWVVQWTHFASHRKRRPVDFLEVFDRMNADAIGLQRAAAQVWLFADNETVALTNAVALAAADVVTAHHQPAVGRAHRYAPIALTGRHSTDLERLKANREVLADARKALVNHTRKTLGLGETDPFAIPLSV
jgi:hypothetical protein